LRRNCLLTLVIEGKMKGKIALTRILGGRHKQLLDVLRKREDSGK